MSRLGKQIIAIPEKTTITMEGNIVTVKGPLGEISRVFRDSEITINIADTVTLVPKRNDVFSRALWGTYASHIKNMLAGVNKAYEKKLILEGVGFKSEVVGTSLNLALGFSHPVKMAIPEGLTVKAEKNVITISGIDKEKVGQFASQVRSMKKPEPYKGKGFRYEGEVIRRKQGKKSA
ncbi:MAG: large subunit ribosomal protein L6 [Parcubacteria group bacterium LiPW_30]|nr:MAG: large subunit ribosomal protein L6 [Parcubacteria group bacterium LiPW_30]